MPSLWYMPKRITLSCHLSFHIFVNQLSLLLTLFAKKIIHSFQIRLQKETKRESGFIFHFITLLKESTKIKFDRGRFRDTKPWHKYSKWMKIKMKWFPIGLSFHISKMEILTLFSACNTLYVHFRCLFNVIECIELLMFKILKAKVCLFSRKRR